MVQAVRGMRDVLPMDARRWRLIEDVVQDTLRAHAYEEVQVPLLEYTELFARGVGEATDIVEKEMYTLADRDGDSLALRPEGTASTVRALQEHGLLYNQTQKVFYAGPMFRYEKPQKGRYRQFYQVGAEAFGFAGPDVDAELIAMCASFWQRLGISEHVRLELNTLGAGGARQAYRDALVAYLTPLAGELDADSQRRLTTNPMRILDSKLEATQALLADAPKLPDFIDDEGKAHFAGLTEILDALGVAYVVNPKLVRGLDYYTHTVFEWITDDLGAQGTICGGGRYDGLVEQLGGRPTPGAGFAMGIDRVALLHQVIHQDQVAAATDVYVCVMGSVPVVEALKVAQRLRESAGQGDRALRVRAHMGGGNLKKQLKKADQSGAAWALLLGEDELKAGAYTLKELGTGAQTTLPADQAIARLLGLPAV